MIKELVIVSDDELESQNLKGRNTEKKKPTGDDPIADWLLKTYYLMSTNSMKGVKIGICISPFLAILLFTVFVSNTASNLIAFTSLVISIVFIGISMWMLCWILDKDQGTREMQDISDHIKEGSEGFFIT